MHLRARCYVVVLAMFASLLAAIPSVAHHSITAEFDPSKQFILKGAITQVDWENPHIYVHLDVRDTAGKTVNWALETYPPSMLKRGGVTRDTFKIGEVVSIDAFPAKDGTKALAYLKRITFADGHSLEIWLGDAEKYK